jgi:DNA-binding transcriptional LysR family regulator
VEMTLHQLRTIREVDARGSIAAAAEALGYTPSAISQQLASLEKAAGVALLERVGRGVRLTSAGRELVRHAHEVLARVEEAQAAIEEVASGPRGEVRMALFASVAGALMPEVLRLLAARHPDLRVRSVQLDPDDAIEAVAAGSLDLAIILDYPHAPAARPNSVKRRLLIQEPFRVVVPAHDPTAEAGPVKLDDLAGRAILAPDAATSCGRCVLQACRDAGFEPDIAHALEEYPAILRLVAAGAGVALVPDLGLVDAGPDVRIVELARPVYRNIEVAYREAAAHRPAARAVLDALTEISDAWKRDPDLVSGGRSGLAATAATS